MDAFVVSFAISFGVVFVAELGDKSQLMALTFATRYRAMPVLLGITIATLVVHAVSVGIGYGLGQTLPTSWISVVAALAFFAFGLWTLRGDSLSDDERGKVDQSTRSAVVAASAAFFLAELGDKTMLATITLATQHGWLGTWLGSTAGMVGADALAIVVGGRLGRHLPAKAVKYGAAALFLLFGGWLLAEAMPQLTAGSPASGAIQAAVWVAMGIALLGLAVVMAGRARQQPAAAGQAAGDETPNQAVEAGQVTEVPGER